MTFKLPPLPYENDALEPVISSETISYHYGKHHQTYVTNLNGLVENTEFADKSLEDIVKTSSGAMFNNAAQVYNHTFYWNCLTPKSKQRPEGDLLAAIEKQYTTFAAFKDEFTKQAVANFGSGWTWLVKKSDGSLALVNTSNAATVLTDNSVKPLLVFDVWEHAYYVDYRNARLNYVAKLWDIVNWDFVAENFA